MNTGNDALARLMSGIDPATTPLGSALGERELALLERVQSTSAHIHSHTGLRSRGTNHGRAARIRRFRVPTFAVVASLIAILVVAATSMSLWPGQTPLARAVTPQPLVAVPLDNQQPETLLLSMSESLRGAHQPAAQRVRFQNWALAFTPDDPPRSIVPQRFDIISLPDGSTVSERRAAGNFDSAGHQLSGSDGPAPGTLLDRHTYQPGQYGYLFSSPDGVTDWGAYLRSGGGLGATPSTGDYFTAVKNLLVERALTSLQQAEMLAFLATLPDIRVDGTVTDRLGRTGVSISTESRDPGRTLDVLVVTPTRGVIAYENVYTGTDRSDLQAPAVIDYNAWF